MAIHPGSGAYIADSTTTQERTGAFAMLGAAMNIGTILGPALGLPEFLHELSLTSHYGLPMLGSWEPAGVIASLTLAIGGIGLGAWGFGRRDLRT